NRPRAKPMKMPKNGMMNSPTIAAAVAIRMGVLGMRSRRIVRPVRTREALQPTSAKAAAMIPVAQEAVEPMIQAQAIMVMMATGEPGSMGKMIPARATNIRRAAMTVTRASTVSDYLPMAMSAQTMWCELSLD